jgi:predicted GNAT family acetyltransferase
MNIDVQNLAVKNNPAENRFEVQLDDKLGVLEYRKKGEVYVLTHTEVPKELRGQGIANRLVHDALEQIKAENGKIVPQCPFVKVYLRRYPEYQLLVEPNPNG